jgi:Ser/Thr protein kinase RdoA (MazF antagonist)
VPRLVTLVLVDPAGEPLGALPPYPAEPHWWQEMPGIVDGARARFGLDVTVLRLLTADRPGPPGGAVGYLAECAAALPAGVPLDPVDPALDLGPHPRRAPWARPGGPGASVGWAAAQLAGAGRRLRAATQTRSWNLSAVWRLDCAGGPAWLKQVPGFFGHEPAVLGWLAATHPALAPPLLAAAGDRLLLDHVPGTDRYDAPLAEVLPMLADLHEIQAAAAGAPGALLGVGVPDARAPALLATLPAVVARHGGELAGRLEPLVAGLPARLAELAACGLPDTLVHGDFYPGNVRADGARRVILDWGDCFVGHPAFDALRVAGWLPPGDGEAVLAAWVALWRETRPGCDPRRAVELLRPVAELRAAAVYALFLDRIEPAERPYHARDVPECLHRAAALAAAAPVG